MITDGSESSGKPLVTISSRRISPDNRQDFSDPDIGMVIRWHISICPDCQLSISARPAVFGKPAKVFCPEYWEIVKEYSEYEWRYAQKGNP